MNTNREELLLLDSSINVSDETSSELKAESLSPSDVSSTSSSSSLFECLSDSFNTSFSTFPTTDLRADAPEYRANSISNNLLSEFELVNNGNYMNFNHNEEDIFNQSSYLSSNFLRDSQIQQRRMSYSTILRSKSNEHESNYI
jgi:hypothetical protein